MKVQYLKILIGLLIVTLVAIAYATTQLSVNNRGTVILANKSFQGVTFSPPLSQPDCATETAYSDGGGTGSLSPISWGNIAQNSSETAYICIRNAGGNGQVYAVSTSSLLPATGITVSYNNTATLTSQPLPNGATSLIVINVSVSLSVPEGTFSFTTMIG